MLARYRHRFPDEALVAASRGWRCCIAAGRGPTGIFSRSSPSWRRNVAMTNISPVPSIDEYLRERLMPVEGAIPHIPGIEMFGNSIPAGTVGGDLFEYINFQQRYDIAARIQQAQRLSREFLEPLPPGAAVRNSVDDHVQWMRGTPGHTLEMEANYRFARSSEQVRVAEDLRDLYSTAGVLLVDAQG